MDHDRRPFLTVSEVGQLLGVSSPRAYALVAAGKIPAVRFGRRIRVPAQAFEKWLANLSDQALREVA